MYVHMYTCMYVSTYTTQRCMAQAHVLTCTYLYIRERQWFVLYDTAVHGTGSCAHMYVSTYTCETMVCITRHSGVHGTGSTSSWTSLLSLSTSSTRCTLIWFVVNVPVLSEQMTEVHPSVSTAGRCRTCVCVCV